VARGSDLRYNLEVDIKDAYTGTKVDLKFPTTIVCETCKGSGAKPGSKPSTCATCNGHGNVTFRQGFFQMSRTCPDCGGTGQVIKEKCKDCHGNGRVRHTKSLQVTIPAGVDDGTRLRLAGEGEAGTHGGPAGDLFVFVSMAPHPIFKRDGIHLHMEVPVSMVDAALGCEVQVPTPDGGKTTLKIPSGSQPADRVRLPGFGMPALGRPRDKGDLIAHLQVSVPTKLDKHQKALLEQLKAGLEPGRAESGFGSKLRKFWGE
jgi:molecular chaperone DnaJ